MPVTLSPDGLRAPWAVLALSTMSRDPATLATISIAAAEGRAAGHSPSRPIAPAEWPGPKSLPPLHGYLIHLLNPTAPLGRATVVPVGPGAGAGRAIGLALAPTFGIASLSLLIGAIVDGAGGSAP